MVLKTERLVLRPWAKSDAKSLYEYAKDPDIGHPAGWPAHKSVRDSRWIIRHILSADETYAVCLRDDDRAIGSVGLIKPSQKRVKLSPNEMEIGYWIGKPFWGNGYIPEAARELLRHAFEDLGCTGIWCSWADYNDKSQRVQEKCGFVFHHTEEDVPCKLIGDIRTVRFSYLSKEDWLRQHEAD